ncbi:DMT family transporter [Deferribacterales bacterium Es71-Z0220]|uniref:DMT family transporter n=1 Tax=Deferrivibrio essentukiensis TaxID=2880922 RepID=UPI001F6197B1|nr:DMT family transporter [Deferrivibrio essentukiensis]MCB4204674.1 DMT family transporter [Deferrivibrio essentukiensis]
MKLKIFFILLSGVISISFAAIFVRFCDDVPPLMIATYRLIFASIIIISVFKFKHYTIHSITRKDFILSIISGTILSVHFYTWFTSIKLTSIASSVVLVTTSPIFVGILSFFLLKEKQNLNIIIGIALSIIGSIVLTMGDININDALNFDKNALIGDIFAIIGAIAAAIYMMIGSKVRENLDIIPYITITYTASALTLLLISLLSGQTFLGYKPSSYTFMFLLAVIPQLIGHTSLNWALKHLKSSMVAIVTLGEPIGAAVLGYLFFREGIDKYQFVGIILIFMAILIASKSAAR